MQTISFESLDVVMSDTSMANLVENTLNVTHV